jgi:surfeit locus 1 family protein
MIRFRPLPVMTVLAIVALAILSILGRWQWERFLEKRALEAAPLAEMTIESYRPIDEGLQLVYGFAEGEAGWRVFAPVRYGETNVFVDADFIAGPTPPDWRTLRFPASLRIDAPISGVSIRPERPSSMAPPPDPVDRVWYAIDLPAMARAAGMESAADYYIAIDYIGEDGRPIENRFARAGSADPLPPERHIGYAITWWGLGVMLLGVYFAYHISTGRLSIGPNRNAETG